MSNDLNPHYPPAERWKAVVDHGTGLLVVNAGPGTGKTYSLLRKIERLLDQKIPAKHIYYLTFVNSIIDAFKADVAKPKEDGGLGASAEDLGIKVSTLHSLAFKIIRTYADRLGLPEHLELYDLSTGSDNLSSITALSDLFEIVKLERVCSRKDFNRDVDALKRVWQGDTSLPAELGFLDGAFGTLQRLYQALPWDRLVPIANQAILEHGLPEWLQQATHFLIDEYQDFNPSEQRHIELVTQPSDSVVVVGDTDQSIYSGRSASPKGLETLLSRAEVSTVNFVLCRRCPPAITTGANKILQLIDPTGSAARLLRPHKTDPGDLSSQVLMSCKAELDLLAKRIKAWVGENVRTVLFLFPSRKALDFYRKELESRNVTTELERGGGEVLLQALLKLAILPRHPFLERFLLGTHPALERRFAPDVLPLMVRDSLSLDDALTQAASTKKWRKDVKEAYAAYRRDLDTLRSRDPQGITQLCAAKGHPVSAEIVSQILADSEDVSATEQVERAIRAQHPESQTTGTRVRLLTMHGSKGLSEPIVVIPALEDKWMPGTAVGEALGEKHRLFYVALTRAEREVFITCPRTRAPKDPLNFSFKGATEGPSRYITRLSRP